MVNVQGDESLKGHMMRTGPILRLMDVLAGSIAMRRGKLLSVSCG